MPRSTTAARAAKLAAQSAAAFLADREKQINSGGLKAPKRMVFRRGNAPETPKLRPLIAYDLETTSIKKGTPAPLYLTAYAGYKESADFWYSGPLRDIEHLGEILEARFLTDAFKGARYVAWNGNNYDVYFVAAALLHSPKYILRPYLTKSKSLRGLKVIDRDNEKRSWEFLDAISMLGMTGRKLSWFLQTFAPEYLKLDAPDWEKETFNAKNKKHVDYAERDSVGLWHGIIAAQKIVLDHFNLPLAPTVGNMGIKIFSHHIPHGVRIRETSSLLKAIIRDFAMRGGYCFCQRKFAGPVWKYDINQAYAAAMRESDLPAGAANAIKRYSDASACAIWRVTATKPGDLIPFYYIDTATSKAIFGVGEIRDAWITSTEYRQLRAEGWRIETHEGYWFESQFRMTEYVDKLESLRVGAPGGPKSSQGEMMKAIGNNSYGKTLERLEGLELILAAECPPGFSEYQDPSEQLQHLWFAIGEPNLRDYHQPQIGAFITAHVRMQVRRAALLNPQSWLYADTDCVVFDSPVDLDIDPTRYGAWKVEASGKEFRIITKKVYASFGADEKHCKGLNVKRLTDSDFIDWFNGRAPTQIQTQRNNFLKVMRGENMFIERTRRGEVQK